jgi:hypothetical protein
MFTDTVFTQLKNYRKTFKGKLSMHECKLFMEVPGMRMEQQVILHLGSIYLYIIKIYHLYQASSKTKSSSLHIAHNFYQSIPIVFLHHISFKMWEHCDMTELQNEWKVPNYGTVHSKLNNETQHIYNKLPAIRYPRIWNFNPTSKNFK